MGTIHSSYEFHVPVGRVRVPVGPKKLPRPTDIVAYRDFEFVGMDMISRQLVGLYCHFNGWRSNIPNVQQPLDSPGCLHNFTDSCVMVGRQGIVVRDKLGLEEVLTGVTALLGSTD